MSYFRLLLIFLLCIGTMAQAYTFHIYLQDNKNTSYFLEVHSQKASHIDEIFTVDSNMRALTVTFDTVFVIVYPESIASAGSVLLTLVSLYCNDRDNFMSHVKEGHCIPYPLSKHRLHHEIVLTGETLSLATIPIKIADLCIKPGSSAQTKDHLANKPIVDLPKHIGSTLPQGQSERSKKDQLIQPALSSHSDTINSQPHYQIPATAPRRFQKIFPPKRKHGSFPCRMPPTISK